MAKKGKLVVSYMMVLAVAVCLYIVPGVSFAEQASFEGVTLKVLIGSGGEAPLFTYHQKYLEKKLGLKFKVISESGKTHYALCMKDWMMGGGSYDLVINLPRWNAEFMAQGYYLPITDYLKSDADAMADYNDIVKKYRKLYCEWRDNIYAIVVDGDGSIMYWRKDILNNPDYQARFKAEYGYELPTPPKTWDEFIDVSQFFSGWDWDQDGKKNYGSFFMQLRPSDVIMPFLPVYMTMSNGLLPFDEQVHPQINNEYGVQALEIMEKVIKTAPPGHLGWDALESWGAVWNGTLAMSLNWGDVGKYLLCDEKGGGCGVHWKGKMGYSQWPGIYHGEKFVSFNPLFWGRIMALTRFTEHPEACYAVMRELLRPERKMISLSDWESCADVYAYSARDASKWDIPIDQEFIDAYLGALDHGVPHLMLPGAEEYHLVAGREITGYFLGKYDEETALRRVEQGWEKVTERLGRTRQQAAWSSYIQQMLNIGFRLK